MSQQSRCRLEVVVVQLCVSSPTILVSHNDVERVLDVLETFRIADECENPFSLQTIGPNARPATWQTVSEAGRWTVKIAYHSSTIRTITSCEPGGAFAKHLHALLGALGVALCASRTRVGLRHSYLLRLGENVHAYGRVLRETLFDRSVKTWDDDDGIAGIPSIEFSLDEATSIICRHGFTLTSSKGDALAYLLETDIYRDDVNLNDSARLLDAIDGIHQDHLRVIRTCLSDEALQVIDWTALPELGRSARELQ
jgi:hypothetical protein